MKLRALGFGVCCAAGPLAGQDVPPKAVPLLDVEEVQPEEPVAPLKRERDEAAAERVISGSGQFVVRGGEADQRGSLASEGERLRRAFFQLIGNDDPHVTLPIEILLHGQVGGEPRRRPLAYELRFTTESFLLRIHVDLARGVDHERIQRAMLSGLVYQESLRAEKPGELESPVLTPVWLVEGLREAAAWREGRGDRRLYEGVFGREQGFGLEVLLDLDEAGFETMDGASRATFRVLSGALVMALLEQPRGREAFVGFLGEVAKFDGELPILLRRHFPELNLSEGSLVKWWALTLAKLADVPLTEVMSIEETEEALRKALVLHHRDADGLSQQSALDAWRTLEDLETPERVAAVRHARSALERLSFRCFPSFRPLLVDYHEALNDWIEGKNLKRLDERLAELAETRRIMNERAMRGRDFLDFVEISAASELSGSFDDYLRLKQELEERPRPVREDPVTDYLDTMDRIYAPPKRRR